jgi:hypothetical protein
MPTSGPGCGRRGAARDRAFRVCSAVLFFGTGLALRVTRLGLAIVGICCRSPPGLNRTHAEEKDADTGFVAFGALRG